MHLNMSSNSNNFRQLSINENCGNLTQIAPAKPSDTPHPTYHIQKRDADAKYIVKVKVELSSHIGGIIFMDPVSLRKAHKELIKQTRSDAIHINNKYKVQLEPFYFEWETFIPTLVKEFPDILSKMLSHIYQQQQQPINSN